LVYFKGIGEDKMAIDPYTAATIGSVAAPVLGGLIGGSQAKKEARRAAALRAQALAQFAGINLPTFEEQLFNLESPDYIGDLVMQQEEAVDLGPTAMDEVEVDPRLKAAQMLALGQAEERAQEGLSAEAMQHYDKAQRAGRAEAQAMSEKALMDMQQRGIGGSGAEQLQKLIAAQASGDAAGQAGLAIAAASEREDNVATDALARLASGMRSQEFGEQSDAARARDAFAQFRAQNTQGVRGRNVDRQNVAGQRNISERQRMADQAANLRNIEEQRRATLHGDQFERERALAGDKASIITGQAGAADKAAGRTADMWSGIGGAIGSGLASFGKTNKADDNDYPSPFKVR
jgi:hypothetical protein